MYLECVVNQCDCIVFLFVHNFRINLRGTHGTVAEDFGNGIDVRPERQQQHRA